MFLHLRNPLFLEKVSQSRGAPPDTFSGLHSRTPSEELSLPGVKTTISPNFKPPPQERLSDRLGGERLHLRGLLLPGLLIRAQLRVAPALVLRLLVRLLHQAHDEVLRNPSLLSLPRYLL